MKILSLILILTVVSGTYAQYYGFGNWFDQAFGSFWQGFEEAFRNIGDTIQTTINNNQWINGPNVCQKEENRTDPFEEAFKGFYDSSNTYDVQDCREIDFKRVCIVRISKNGSTREVVRTYECCKGYVGSENNGKRECVKK